MSLPSPSTGISFYNLHHITQSVIISILYVLIEQKVILYLQLVSSYEFVCACSLLQNENLQVNQS